MIGKKYHGLCVGGPLAGQRKECPSERMVAPILKDELGPPISRLEVPDRSTSVEYFPYQHVQHFYVTEGERETVLSFWVPASERHPRRFVVEELVRAYEAGGRA